MAHGRWASKPRRLTSSCSPSFTPASNYVSSSLFPYAVTDMGRDSRMLLYYRFHPSDLALDGTVADASGNGRDGLLLSLGGGIFAFANTAPFPLFNQTSLQLVQSGSNSAARLTRDITDVGLSDRSWTFGCWFLRATTNDEDFLFYVGDGNGHGGSGDELEIYGSTDQSVWLAHYNILGLPDARLASGKLSNQWHHVALTFERTNNCSGWLRFYVDGIIISRPLDITWALNQGQPLVVGGHSATNSNLSR